MNAEDADILVVTETKTPEIDLPALNDRYEVRLSLLDLLCEFRLRGLTRTLLP